MQQNSSKFLLPLIAVCALITLSAGLVPQVSQHEWENVVLHMIVELLGAFGALALALLLSFSRPANDHIHQGAISGLLAMGILDGLHAMSAPGDQFVWLHSLAMLYGGIFFASVLLGGSVNVRTIRRLPFIAMTLAIGSGIASMANPAWIPSLINPEGFTLLAHSINMVGGLLFMVAGLAYWSRNDRKQNQEHKLLAILCLMFGTAGIAFSFSALWNTSWWFWHAVRLGAYLYAIHYSAKSFIGLFHSVRDKEALIRMIMDNTQSGIITMNEKSIIQSSNRATENMFGYSSHDLIGQSALMLFKPPTGDLIGCRKDGSTFPMNVNISEVPLESGRLFVLEITDITEQLRRVQHWTHLAQHDPLTRLPNRSLLMDRLTQANAQAHRHGRMTAIYFIDLDSFKQINDTLGHTVGDALLQGVAQRLKGIVREGDTICRFGGDEFVLIVCDLEKDGDAVVVAQKILQSLGEPLVIKNSIVKTAASIGICLYSHHGCKPEELLIMADSAMYRAKLAGGNRYCLAPSIYGADSPTNPSSLAVS